MGSVLQHLVLLSARLLEGGLGLTEAASRQAGSRRDGED